jgi:hypothetical protein
MCCARRVDDLNGPIVQDSWEQSQPVLGDGNTEFQKLRGILILLLVQAVMSSRRVSARWLTCIFI